jgi:hypothetical protein
MVHGRAETESLFRADLRDGPMVITFESIDLLEGGSLVVDVGPIHHADRHRQVRRRVRAAA